VEAAVDKSRDIANRSSSVSRSIHQLCVIITKAAKEENNHAGNKEVDMQVDKIRSDGKKEKEKVHVSAGEWRMIMTAVNHGTDIPADSRRKVLMGYQYALHQRKKKLRKERDMIMRSPDYNSTPSERYWSEYSNSSESSMERQKDPKHNRRTTAQIREESYAKSQSPQQSEDEEDFVQENTRSSVGSSTGVPTNHTTRARGPTRAHASGRNTKSRVGRRQTNGKTSRGKSDTWKRKAKRRI
jgi:hypothetical protein